MRKTLIALLILILAMPILWLWRGRDLSMLIDRFGTIETASMAVQRLDWNSSKLDSFRINDLELSLRGPGMHERPPEIGLTKPGNVAMAFDQKVFPFGAYAGGADEGIEYVSGTPDNGDVATLVNRQSVLPWLRHTNLMTGKSPSLQRHQYYQLTWKKPNGAKLKMLWSVDPDNAATSLIRIDISNAGR